MALSATSKSLHLAFAPEVPQSPSAGDRLDSWKEIANFLGREVRTVQLWEKREGLPVHRHFHSKQGSLFAFRSELDAWRRGVSRDSSATSIATVPRHAPSKALIAVLPFESLTHASGQKSFNDGVMSEIITALGSVCQEHLGVISRSSVMQHKGSAKQAQKLGRSLNVHYLLEGSTQVEKGQVRVNIALVGVTDRAILYSKSYTTKFENIFQVQSRVANQVAYCISHELLSSGGSFPHLRPMADPAPQDVFPAPIFLQTAQRGSASEKRPLF
jgi:TolB-like protein